MRPSIRRLASGATAAAALVAAGPSAADSGRLPQPPPSYLEECGACHVAFPARMLGAPSWRAVLEQLDRHFGVDASVDAETLGVLRVYLEGNARSRPTPGVGTSGRPALRITETRWFREEHDEVPRRLWQGPDAVKPSDCGACHRAAAQGRFSEHDLRLPGKGEVQ